jgi:hypothetical protein
MRGFRKKQPISQINLSKWNFQALKNVKIGYQSKI